MQIAAALLTFYEENHNEIILMCPRNFWMIEWIFCLILPFVRLSFWATYVIWRLHFITISSKIRVKFFMSYVPRMLFIGYEWFYEIRKSKSEWYLTLFVCYPVNIQKLLDSRIHYKNKQKMNFKMEN